MKMRKYSSASSMHTRTDLVIFRLLLAPGIFDHSDPDWLMDFWLVLMERQEVWVVGGRALVQAVPPF